MRGARGCGGCASQTTAVRAQTTTTTAPTSTSECFPLSWRSCDSPRRCCRRRPTLWSTASCSEAVRAAARSGRTRTLTTTSRSWWRRRPSTTSRRAPSSAPTRNGGRCGSVARRSASTRRASSAPCMPRTSRGCRCSTYRRSRPPPLPHCRRWGAAPPHDWRGVSRYSTNISLIEEEDLSRAIASFDLPVLRPSEDEDDAGSGLSDGGEA